MEPRDVFDAVVVALVAAIVYFEVFGFGVSADRFDRLVAFFENQGIETYLLLAGLLGVVFVGYLVLYAPDRFLTDAGR